MRFRVRVLAVRVLAACRALVCMRSRSGARPNARRRGVTPPTRELWSLDDAAAVIVLVHDAMTKQTEGLTRKTPWERGMCLPDGRRPRQAA